MSLKLKLAAGAVLFLIAFNVTRLADGLELSPDRCAPDRIGPAIRERVNGRKFWKTQLAALDREVTRLENEVPEGRRRRAMAKAKLEAKLEEVRTEREALMRNLGYPPETKSQADLLREEADDLDHAVIMERVEAARDRQHAKNLELAAKWRDCRPALIQKGG